MAQNKLSEDDLKTLLRDYFYPVGIRRCAAMIDQIALAYMYGEFVEIPEQLAEGVANVAGILESLAVSYGTYYIPSVPGIEGRYPTHRGIVIQDIAPLSQLSTDREQVLSICYHDCLARLNEKHPTNIHHVSSLHLLGIILGEFGGLERLYQVVRMSMIYSVNGLVGTGRLLVDPNALQHVLPTFDRKLPELLCLYLCAEESSPPPPQYKKQSVPYEKPEGIIEVGDLGDFLAVKRLLHFSIDNVGAAARNMINIMANAADPVDAKVRQCLLLRKENVSEDDISATLGFTDPDQYQDWQERNHINIAFRQSDTTYDDWLIAKDRLLGGKPIDLASKGRVVDNCDNENINSRLPVLRLHPTNQQVWLDDEEIVLKPTKLNRFDALFFLLSECLKTGRPVPGHRIVKVAGAKKGTNIRDIFKASPKINNLLMSPRRGFWTIKVDLQKSKDR